MRRAALVSALCLATAASWSRLEIALQNYPRVHDRNLRAFEKGDPAARIVRAKVKNGLGNREQALLSCFALALAAEAALVVEWPPRGCDNYGRELQRHGPMSRARWTVHVPTATAGRFRGGAAGAFFICIVSRLVR